MLGNQQEAKLFDKPQDSQSHGKSIDAISAKKQNVLANSKGKSLDVIGTIKNSIKEKVLPHYHDQPEDPNAPKQTAPSHCQLRYDMFN